MSKFLPAFMPCETCPERMEYQMRVDHPDKLRAMTLDVVPGASDGLVGEVLDDSASIHAGMEAGRPDCPGYRAGRLVLGTLADKFMGGAVVSATERHCNNPYLQSTEYHELHERITTGSMWDRRDKEQAERGEPVANRQRPNFWGSFRQLSPIDKAVGVGAMAVSVFSLSILIGAAINKSKPETAPPPKGLPAMAYDLENMHLGWAQDEVRPDPGIAALKTLPDGEQIETILFTKGNESVPSGTTSVNPYDVAQINVTIYKPGVNVDSIEAANQTIAEYWFQSPPFDDVETPGVKRTDIYGVGVSYPSQQKTGVIGMEAFQSDTVNTYANSKTPSTWPYERLVHKYGNPNSANATIDQIEDQVLMAARAASHDRNISLSNEIQHPK